MIQDIIERYLAIFPGERANLQPLLGQLAAGEQLNNRKNFNGHITGNGIILSPDRRQFLVVHHRFLDVWIQPGGHWEADDASPLEAAWRESEEETGAAIDRQLVPAGLDKDIPVFLGVFQIPAQPAKQEPPHVHYDFRYVFIAKNKDFKVSEKAILEARWANFDEPWLDSGINIDRLRYFHLID